MVRTLALVALGGGAGSMLRYLTSLWVGKHIATAFPLATFLINCAGCLLIGILAGIVQRHQLTHPDFSALFITGFCGGFTTFSAFAAENLHLMQTGQSLVALLYMSGSVLLGILAVWLGMALVR